MAALRNYPLVRDQSAKRFGDHRCTCIPNQDTRYWFVRLGGPLGSANSFRRGQSHRSRATSSRCPSRPCRVRLLMLTARDAMATVRNDTSLAQFRRLACLLIADWPDGLLVTANFGRVLVRDRASSKAAGASVLAPRRLQSRLRSVRRGTDRRTFARANSPTLAPRALSPRPSQRCGASAAVARRRANSAHSALIEAVLAPRLHKIVGACRSLRFGAS